MKNRMLFDYINSLDSQKVKQWVQDRRKLVSLYACYARCHGFTRAIDTTQRSSTKTRYRLMRPVNEWNLPQVKIDTSCVLI